MPVRGEMGRGDNAPGTPAQRRDGAADKAAISLVQVQPCHLPMQTRSDTTSCGGEPLGRCVASTAWPPRLRTAVGAIGRPSEWGSLPISA
jgi:hypothetical protein